MWPRTTSDSENYLNNKTFKLNNVITCWAHKLDIKINELTASGWLSHSTTKCEYMAFPGTSIIVHDKTNEVNAISLGRRRDR